MLKMKRKSVSILGQCKYNAKKKVKLKQGSILGLCKYNPKCGVSK